MSNYFDQSRAAAAAWPKSHPLRFLTLYGHNPNVDPAIIEVASRQEAARFMFLFNHPFGADLMGCAETNS